MSSSEVVPCYACTFFKRTCSICHERQVEKSRAGIVDWAISITDSGTLLASLTETERTGLALAVAEYRKVLAGGAA